MKCSICFSDRTEVYRKIQSPFINHKYSLRRCLDCQSHFVNAGEFDFDLEQHYNNEERNANDRNHNFQTEFRRSKEWSHQVALIKKLYGQTKEGLSILDIGCRTGDFLMHWGETDRKFGVELNTANAEVARERNIKIYNDFIENIEFEEKFDVVTCYALLEHLAEPGKFLNTLSELLKENGILVILIPTMECTLRKVLDRKDIHWHMYSPPEHLAYYSRSFLDSHFSKGNLSLIKRYYTSGGILAKYFFTNYTKLLKRTDFERLNYYVYKERFEPKMNKLQMFFIKLLNTFVDKLERFTPITRYPYTDHMYSYYRKIRSN